MKRVAFGFLFVAVLVAQSAVFATIGLWLLKLLEVNGVKMP